MNVEQVNTKPTGEGPTTDPYDLAEAEFMRRVEALQEIGEMRRASQIQTEEELDDHFDTLSRLYRQVCKEMALPWPPLPRPGTETINPEVEMEPWPSDWA